MNTTRPVIITHANCMDGFTCKWLLAKLFPDSEFVDGYYGQSPPDCTSRSVIMADFSFKRPTMLELIRQTRGHLVVLDHHKSSEADLAGIDFECYKDTLDEMPFIQFDMNKSGGRLTWDWLQGRVSERFAVGPLLGVRPWLVDYTEDRDLWRWQLPDSRAVSAALASYPKQIEVWSDLEQIGDKRWESIVAEGYAILRCEQQIVDSHVRNAREVSIAGHKVLAVNATTLFSEIAGELAKDRPFGACWFVRQDGQYQWSLRSRDGGLDVSDVAKQFGGGGHKAASGFQSLSLAEVIR